MLCTASFKKLSASRGGSASWTPGVELADPLDWGVDLQRLLGELDATASKM